ncbi:MAG: 6-carboxytetrahydropterin synthase, partial [Elusimicrobiota bacterium]
RGGSMYSVTKLVHFCYGHRLLDYAGKCRNLHGHNAVVEIRIRGRRLDRLGMVMDFEAIKSSVQRWIDSELDHKLILNRRDPVAASLRKHGQPMTLLPGNPTAEAIAKLIYDHARSRKLPVASVKVWETPSSHACYGTGA